MGTIRLFTDGSADINTGTGYGAYLVVPESLNFAEVQKEQLHVKRFENTSSTRLELETLLWALSCINAGKNRIEIYTDSQNILSLQDRRNRLEQKEYRSGSNRLLKNHDLYKAFFSVTDLLDYELVKIEGHLPARKKEDINRLFALVDKASRNALRKALRK